MSADELLEHPAPHCSGWLARLVSGFCRLLAFGELKICFPDGTVARYHGRFAGCTGVLEIRHPRMLVLRLLLRGEVGFGEAYMDGHWDSPDLTALLEVLQNNEEHLQTVWQGIRWSCARDRLIHRDSIVRHAEPDSDFYQRWLDDSMSYSCAVFEDAQTESLELAQQRKYLGLLDSLRATPGDHILDLGCGWGGFAEVAAHHGLRVTGVTRSPEQLDYARSRMMMAGVADQVTLRLGDDRDIQGQFDHAVSIGMLEMVGEARWLDYYQTLRRLVRPGGRIALQVITIMDDVFPIYRIRPDFVQIHIFPGGMLPAPEHLAHAARDAGLLIRETRWFGDDYAETLRRWRVRFQHAAEEIDALGYDEPFRRMWDYYLAYCEAGFRTGVIDLVQTVLEVPADRPCDDQAKPICFTTARKSVGSNAGAHR